MRTLIAMACATSLIACASAPQIKTDTNPQAQFSQYRTFNFAQPFGSDQAGYASLTSQRLKTAIGEAMKQRGYQLNTNQPDLLVNVGANINEQTWESTAPMPTGYYSYRGGFYRAWPSYSLYTETHRYFEGTLNIDIVDAKAKELVWEGVLSKAVNPKATVSETQIKAAVDAIMAKYPHQAAQ